MKRGIKAFDILTAVILSAAICCLGLWFCDSSHDLGDDFAGYILEARAIADGTLSEQLRLNLYLHPSTIYSPDLLNTGELTYVWGYPLMLAVVYQLVGYDIRNPMLMYYYKIPGIVCFGLFAGVLFLFYKKRFGRFLSFLLSACLVFSIFRSINLVQTDFPFLFLTFLSFLMYEAFRDCESRRGKIIYGIFLGFAMWFTVETRLNGFTVTILILLMHLIYLYRSRPPKKELLLQVLPHLMMLALFALSALLLPIPSSNMADVGQGSLLEGLTVFWELMKNWAIDLTTPYLRFCLNWLMRFLTVLFVLGLFHDARGETLCYAIFVLGTVYVNATLPYTQGMRYYFNILPLILMFIAYGGLFLYNLIKRIWKNRHYQRFVAAAAGICLALFTAVRAYTVFTTVRYYTWELADNISIATSNLYSESCLEAWDFIRNNTPQDAVIAFMKPRSMYLNTGRLSFRPGINGHQMDEADYYMEFTEYHGNVLTEEEYRQMTSVFSNGAIQIFHKGK